MAFLLGFQQPAFGSLKWNNAWYFNFTQLELFRSGYPGITVTGPIAGQNVTAEEINGILNPASCTGSTPQSWCSTVPMMREV